MAALLTSQMTFAVDTKDAKDTVKLKSLEDAAAAAKTWLALVDTDKYAESWDQASRIMQLTIHKDEWVKVMNKTRKPLGNLLERNVLDERTAKNPHGLPPGDYMVMFYGSDFAHKKNIKELLTLHLEDGKWKVLTYQVN